MDELELLVDSIPISLARVSSGKSGDDLISARQTLQREEMHETLSLIDAALADSDSFCVGGICTTVDAKLLIHLSAITFYDGFTQNADELLAAYPHILRHHKHMLSLPKVIDWLHRPENMDPSPGHTMRQRFRNRIPAAARL